MAALDILSITVKPTLMLAVEFVPAALAPDHYLVTATTGLTSYTATGSGPVISVQVLKYGVPYTVTVSSVSPNATGASTAVTPAPVVSNAAVLRQKLYDIVVAADLDMENRDLYVLADEFGRPRSFHREPKSNPYPCLEIQIPKLTGAQLSSGFRRREVWEVSLKLAEASDDSDQAIERLILLMDKIRNAVDSVQNLGLAYLCIVDDGWMWSMDADPVDANKSQSITFKLTITFDVQVGKLPYARV